MTPIGWVMGASASLCALTLAMTLRNLALYRRAGDRASGASLSVCVPARNEAGNIGACVRSALSNDHPDFEVLVYDDESEDGTGEIVRRMAQEDPRVRVVPTAALPEGWNGKQFACARMAEAARGAWLLFTDADVRFEPSCFSRAIGEAERLGCALLSTAPRQITGTLGERLVVPMIHFLLLSYLPMDLMRRTMAPSASAGVGQFLLVRREAYGASGGHGAFASTMHDGVRMPRAVRRAGFRTDLFDGTDLVSCRMYGSWRGVWRGFTKNAYEGLGSFGALAFMTAMHAVGHLAPWMVAAWALISGAGGPSRGATVLAIAAIALAIAQRALLAARFRQSWVGVALHPASIALMTAIQWWSFALHLRGGRAWRGRVSATR